MENYQAEVTEFLASVDEKQNDAERIVNEVVVVQSIEHDSSDTGEGNNNNNNSNDKIDLINGVAEPKRQKSRFIWKYETVKQNEVGNDVTVTVNPFLDDCNLQDLYFSEKVLAVAPFRAKHGQYERMLSSMVNSLINCVHSDGTKPLNKLTEYSAKRRITAYLNLAEQWSDKTGAVFDDGTRPDEDMHEKGYNNLTVKEKILFNVEAIIEEHACMKNQASKENEKVEVDKREKIGVGVLLTGAMGNIKDATGAAPVDNAKILDETHVTPLTKAPVAKRVKASNWAPYDIAIDSLERAARSDISSSEERVKLQEQRDRQKHEESMKRLELETQRHEADVKQKDSTFRFQQEQATRDNEYRMEQLLVQKQSIEMQKEQAQLMRLFFEKFTKDSK